jgi:hypothetical protein
MSAPEQQDEREATLRKVAEGLPIDSSASAETAWNLVRGEKGFEDESKAEANRIYVSGAWAAIRAAAVEKQRKEAQDAPKQEEQPKDESPQG